MKACGSTLEAAAFFDHVLKVVHNQQDSAEAEIIRGPPRLANDCMESVQQRLDRLEFLTYEVPVLIDEPCLVETFNGSEETGNEPWHEFGRGFQANMRTWVPIVDGFDRTLDDVVKETKRCPDVINITVGNTMKHYCS